ncbi:MAG: hypothetical protein U1E97_09880 [Alphaproteobacteria bacterium]
MRPRAGRGHAATRRAAALGDPLLQAVLRTFPGATVETIRDPQAAVHPVADGLAADDDGAFEPSPDDGDMSA